MYVVIGLLDSALSSWGRENKSQVFTFPGHAVLSKIDHRILGVKHFSHSFKDGDSVSALH